MADKKISQLTSATLPLTGAEEFPVVQSGVTVKATIANTQAAPVAAGIANGIQYLNASKVPSTSSSLNFDGTSVGHGVAASGSFGFRQVFTGTTGASQYGFFVDAFSNSSGTANTIGFRSRARTSAAAYTTALAVDYLADTVGLGAGSAITTAVGFLCSDQTVGTNNYGFYSLVSDGVNKFNIYASGTAPNYFAGNLIFGTAAKGVNFTANTPAAGMTSQLLNWYEEGTWTPTMTSASGITTVNSSSGLYTRTGRCVFVEWFVNYTTDASVGTSTFTFGGLPFTCNASQTARGFVALSNWTGADYNDGVIYVNSSATTMTWASRAVNQSSRTNAQLYFSASYFV